MQRTKIVDLLRRTDYGAEVCVKGWVRTRRGSKSVNFIALNDGSTIHNVQVVADVERRADEGIDPDDLATFYKVLDQLTRNLEAVDADPAEAFEPLEIQ